jgi:hypothetical protein
MDGSAAGTSDSADLFFDYATFVQRVGHGAQKHRSRRTGGFHVARKVKDPCPHYIER